MIENNNKIIEDIFNKYQDSIFDNYKKYDRRIWQPLIYKVIWNYSYATKEQRSNSFLENYNRRIKTVLSK